MRCHDTTKSRPYNCRLDGTLAKNIITAGGGGGILGEEKMENEEEKWSVLKGARNLRNAENWMKKVGISLDLSKEDRKKFGYFLIMEGQTPTPPPKNGHWVFYSFFDVLEPPDHLSKKKNLEKNFFFLKKKKKKIEIFFLKLFFFNPGL